jgi:hypothetical protein
VGPEKERGRKLLLQGKNYWTKFRNTKKVIPIGRREAIGNSSFAIADVFQIDTEEYDPTVVGEEVEQTKRILKVHMDARNKDAPYASIDYYVTAEDHFPVKALFFGVSGKHLKTLTVETSKEMGGMLRVETMRMSDAVLTDRYSIWHTKTLTIKEIPDQVFSKDYMMRQ